MRTPFRPHSLRTGAAVGFVTYGAFVCAVVLACLAHAGQQLAIKSAQDKALAIAATAALSADATAHAQLAAGGDERAFQRISRQHHDSWAALPGPIVIYTMVSLSADEGWRYVAAPTASGARTLRPGDMVRGDYRPLLDRALTTRTIDPKPYTGPRGTWVRAYAPLHAPDGTAVAVIGAEVPVPTADLLGEVRWFGVAVILLVIGMGAAVGVWRCAPVIRALRALTDASIRVARGHPFEPLPARGHIEIARLTTAFNQMAAATKDHAHEANTDGLTGLYNHRYFDERLAQEVTRASRYGHRVALLMIDIDHFKAFNDRYGHPAGDDVLKQVAQAIRGAVRDIDVLARYGGEEFVVIMPEADSFVGMEQAELIRLAIRRHHFQVQTDKSLNGGHRVLDEPEVCVSIGVAECPANASDPESFVMAADLALLRAKQMGRDRVCAYQAINLVEGEGDCREVHRLIHQERAAGANAAADDEPFTCARCRSVTRYAMTLAHSLGLPSDDSEEVRRAGLWLDVNRIKQHHLRRAGSEESAADLCQASPTTTQGLLMRTFRASSVPANVLHMREWYNGQGYPDRLAGDQIPLTARILAIADTYERLLTGNGHGDPLTPAEALSALEGLAGTQLDPRLVAIFRSAIEGSNQESPGFACAASSGGGGQDRRQPEAASSPLVA